MLYIILMCISCFTFFLLMTYSVQSLSRVRLCDPMNCSAPGPPSITISQSPPKPMSIESVMPSNYLILCCPLLLLPSIFPSIRVFSNESALCIRWPKYWGFSFNISPSNEHPGLISFRVTYYFLLILYLFSTRETLGEKANTKQSQYVQETMKEIVTIIILFIRTNALITNILLYIYCKVTDKNFNITTFIFIPQ